MAAKKKTGTKVDQKTEGISRNEARQMLRAAKKQRSKDIIDFGSRQTNPEEGIFKASELKRLNLLQPPYDPFKLYRIVESSTMLGSCIETMIDNVHGFGHEFQYIGKQGESKTDEVVEEKQNLTDFFKRVNEEQSFTRMRKEVGRDYEVTGNGFMEVVRYMDNSISTIYRADSRYIRLQIKQETEIPIDVKLIRNGMIRKTKIYKRFRRYAMITTTRLDKIRWFKEYGDPRKMCSITGKYENELEKDEKIQEEASEIIHIKQGNDSYGIPKWVGISSTVLGVRNADFVNYDLFENQAIPPLAILVSGGRLTSESVQDIIDILNAGKGVENFHKIAVLEALGTDSDEISDKATNARVDFKSLPQQDDILFKGYIVNSEKRIREKFRLPPLYTGSAEEYSRSTSDSSKLVAEEQVFRPERNDFDETVNFTIMNDLGATNFAFRTTGPKLIEGNEAIEAISRFSRAGALSINQGIKIMNRVLDLDAPTYSAEWADYPANMVFELARQGYLKGIEEVADFTTAKETLDVASEKLREKATNEDGYEDLMQEIEAMKIQVEEIYDRMVRG